MKSICTVRPDIHTHGSRVVLRGEGGGGTPSLTVSRYVPRFCPPFGIWTIFLPHKIWPWLPFYSDLVGSDFEAPHFHPISFWPPKLTKFIIFLLRCTIVPVPAKQHRRIWVKSIFANLYGTDIPLTEHNVLQYIRYKSHTQWFFPEKSI